MRFWSWVGGLTLLSAVLTANGAEVAKKIPSDDGQALRPLDNMAVTSALTQLAPTPSTTAETTYQGEKHFLVAETHYQPPPLEPGAQIPGVKVDRLNQTVGGIRVRAMLAWPSKGRPTAAALIIHEWWGLNPAVELEAQRLAGQGFKVLAIDLYGGELAEGRREAAKLARRAQEQSDQTRAMLKAALGYLAKPEGGKTLKVAVIGWGLGAGWALRLAAADTRPAAVVVFHGELPRDPKQLARLSCPILGVFAGRDAWVTPDKVESFTKALRDSKATVQTISLDANPGFYLNPRGTADLSYAETAREKMMDFLERMLK